MNIQIGKYWLSSDRHNYIISKPPVKDKRGFKTYPRPTYYSSLSSAFTGLLERRLRQTDATTLGELKNAHHAYRQELSTVIEEQFDTELEEAKNADIGIKYIKEKKAV